MLLITHHLEISFPGQFAVVCVVLLLFLIKVLEE